MRTSNSCKIWTAALVLAMTVIGCEGTSGESESLEAPTNETPTAEEPTIDVGQDPTQGPGSETNEDPSEEPTGDPVEEPGEDPIEEPRLDDDLLPLSCATPATVESPAMAWRLTLTLDFETGETEIFATYDLAHGEAPLAPAAPDGMVELDEDGTGVLSFVLVAETPSIALSLSELDDATGAWHGTAEIQGAEMPITCWAEDWTLRYEYDPATGTCRDTAGSEGRNALPVELVRETRQGECADLSGLSINEENLAYPSLEGWNLRGAELAGASLHFANLFDAALEGADMGRFGYGYAEMTGTIDEYTVLPTTGCEIEGGGLELNCWQ